jgi:hypothetical protein|tara:strand:+ start:777 stop:926 length:150 start_codon:yes stop_codon:yes gene_type:complete
MAKKKQEAVKLTNEQRVEQLKGQQEQLKEAFMKVQGAIEMLEAIIEEDK